MDNYNRMINEKLYIASYEEVKDLIIKRDEALDEFNSLKYKDILKGKDILKKIFKGTKNNFFIMKPFYCDYGAHITIGENFYANADCIFLDVADITIGDNCFMGPRVNLFTAGHPIDKDVRKENLEYGKKITIGDDVWIGGGTTVNPGVTIGSNVVIGSGSVVCKDIPSNVIACGNPCRILRPITNEDKLYWNGLKEEYYKEL